MSEYPSDETCDRITNWSILDPVGCLEFMASHWSYPDRVHIIDATISFSTGGWSGNESLIQALAENVVLWSVCWLSSIRGGHYTFLMENPTRESEQLG